MFFDKISFHLPGFGGDPVDVAFDIFISFTIMNKILK